MSPEGYIQLAVFLATVAGMIFGWAKTQGKNAQMITTLKERIEKIENRDPVRGSLCDTRVAEYRTALSNSIHEVHEEIKEIKKRLDTMDMSRDRVSSEWDTKLHAVQTQLAELSATTSKLCTNMESMTRSIELIMKKILKVE